MVKDNSAFLSRRFITFVALGALNFLSSCMPESSFASSGNKPGVQHPEPEPAPASTTTTQPSPTQPTKPPQPITPIPAPPQAITKGSFTVWADPANPQEFEPYQIHILVKLPSQTTKYSKFDLTGTLIGTDGYYQGINETPGQLFLFTPGEAYAKLIMNIPGAEMNVRDSINVRSELINESQSISIVFQ